MKIVGITGATGFVGGALCTALMARDKSPRRFLRQIAQKSDPADVVVGNIGPDTDWRTALSDVDCVVHLAARTHVLEDRADNPLATYRRINVEATRNLAQQAATAGVRRFVFLSSIKVNGESTPVSPYTENDQPQPLDAYGITKYEAEIALGQIGAETGMETVVLRPPLVYGPGVKGNFLRLMRMINRGMPLPLASVKNQRSLIYVENLTDAIIACMDTPDAAGQTYLVSDAQISTPELITRMAVALDKPLRLLPCPAALLEFGASLLGKRETATRLTGSLTVDSSRIRRELGWQPRCSLDQGLNATAQWYHRTKTEGTP